MADEGEEVELVGAFGDLAGIALANARMLLEVKERERLEQEVAVTYRTAEGTATYATPTNDLEDTTSLVTFPAGSMSAGMVSRTFGVVVIDDNINEATESFSVNFVGVAPTPRITNNTMSVTTNITDNDTATLTIDDVTVTEGTFGEPTIASFTITTDTRSQGVLSVTGTTLDGTAQAGGLGGGGRTIRTIAGNGTAGFAGDGGQGASAQINNPADTVIDPANGRVYFIDASNQRIRVINVQSGTIATVAGTGVSGFQNGAGFQATFRFNTQSRMVLAPDGSSLIFTDTNNHAVRRFNLTSGEVTTVVNTAGAAGFAGDGGLAPAARLNNPTGLAFDPSGQLYIADAGNRRIRRVLTDSTIETFAGTGGAGDNTDNVPRLTATFDSLRGMAFGNGFLYVCEFLNDRVYRISSTTVTRFVGIGTDGFNGDGLAPGVTQLVDPEDVVVLRNGDVAIADVGQNRVRLVDVSANVVSTIVGNGTATPYTGDLTNLAAESQVDPRGLALAPSGERVVSGGADRAVRAFDLSSGQLGLIGEHKDAVSCVAVSADMPQVVLSGSWDRTLVCWDLREGPASVQQVSLNEKVHDLDVRWPFALVGGASPGGMPLDDLLTALWREEFRGFSFKVFDPLAANFARTSDDEGALGAVAGRIQELAAEFGALVRMWRVQKLDPRLQVRGE